MTDEYNADWLHWRWELREDSAIDLVRILDLDGVWSGTPLPPAAATAEVLDYLEQTPSALDLPAAVTADLVTRELISAEQADEHLARQQAARRVSRRLRERAR